MNQVGKKSVTWYRKDLQVNNLKLATVGKISKIQGRKMNSKQQEKIVEKKRTVVHLILYILCN